MRISEHKKAAFMFDRNSELACHVDECHHHMDFENVEVLWRVRNTESFPVLFGDQKFWTLCSVLWGIRYSEPFLVFFGVSEILSPF